MTQEKLAEVLAAHLKWVRGEEGGIRANLRGAYLEGADLQDADLKRANLRGAYLVGANLRDANLEGAYLEGAYLRGADLRDATIVDGRRWEDYSSDHLAGICQTPEIRAKAVAAWGAHSWSDCPMHNALGISNFGQAENPRAVACWVALYDANLLSKPDLLSTQDVTP